MMTHVARRVEPPPGSYFVLFSPPVRTFQMWAYCVTVPGHMQISYGTILLMQMSYGPNPLVENCLWTNSISFNSIVLDFCSFILTL